MKKLMILVLCGLSWQQMHKIEVLGKLNDGCLRLIWKDIRINHSNNGKPMPIPYAICDQDANCKGALRKLGTRYYSHQGDGIYPLHVTEN